MQYQEKCERRSARNRLQSVATLLLLLLTVLPVFFFCGPPKPREVPGTVRGEEPIPPYNVLEARLKSEVWGERSGAILEIMRGEYRQAVPELTRLLTQDPHPAVRQTAALALGDFQARAAGPAIGRMITGDTETGPDYLMDALARMGDPANARYVLPMLESNRDVLRLKAVETLGILKAKQAAGDILAMARRNRDRDKARTYAMALGMIGAQQAAPYLIQLASREPAGPTLAAAYLALGRVGSAAGVPVLAAALTKDFDKGRENAVAALVQIKDKSALPRVFPLLEHKDAAARFSAAEVIAGIPDADSGPRALTILKKREAPSIAPAVFVLGRLKYSPAREEIEIQLSDASAPEREALARSLGWLGDAKSVPLLIRVLSEQSGEGRYGAAWALGVLGDERALDPLRAAAKSNDRKLALYATEALGGLASPAALGDLEAAVNNRPEIRYAAVDAIAVTPGDEAREILEGFAAASNSDLELQLAAVRALGNRKSPESIPTLIGVVDKGSTETARAAMAALRNITGLKYENRSQWRHWDEMRER
ncbi:MAG: HEAT repeat domain-containing protein [bacterium]|nr:HEAT repeat domain-containing protein [bacterium]